MGATASGHRFTMSNPDAIRPFARALRTIFPRPHAISKMIPRNGMALNRASLTHGSSTYHDSSWYFQTLALRLFVSVGFILFPFPL